MTTTAEQEVRATFDRWFAESSARDLDAMMAHIAPDAVSYEHDAPLQHVGVEAIRAVCQRGLDAAEGEFRWDSPDLRVVVRGDIAVAWGLNHMRGRQPDGKAWETYSRGTRVFQHRGGAWQMIHQHVSYPYDPRTGEAKTDLKP